MHEKGLQGQKGAGTQVSGQELFVPLINRLLNGDFVPPSVPGHALHEKSLQRQKGVAPLVSSQDERALAVPVVNRLSIAGQTLILFLCLSKYGFFLFVLLERH